MNNMQVTEPIVTRAPEPDWSGWEKWLRSHLDIEREFMIEVFGEDRTVRNSLLSPHVRGSNDLGPLFD